MYIQTWERRLIQQLKEIVADGQSADIIGIDHDLSLPLQVMILTMIEAEEVAGKVIGVADVIEDGGLVQDPIQDLILESAQDDTVEIETEKEVMLKTEIEKIEMKKGIVSMKADAGDIIAVHVADHWIMQRLVLKVDQETRRVQSPAQEQLIPNPQKLRVNLNMHWLLNVLIIHIIVMD